MENVYEALAYIQQNLEVAKDRRNDFGCFNYRSAEDILEALKPLVKQTDCVLIMSDNLVSEGDRFYIVSRICLRHYGTNGEVWALGYAREPEHKTKSDDMQVTGMASSYAKKYALCNLFAIDNGTPDVDSQDNTSIIAACTACGMQYQFESQGQIAQCQCECGNHHFMVVS